MKNWARTKNGIWRNLDEFTEIYVTNEMKDFYLIKGITKDGIPIKMFEDNFDTEEEAQEVLDTFMDELEEEFYLDGN